MNHISTKTIFEKLANLGQRPSLISNSTDQDLTVDKVSSLANANRGSMSWLKGATLPHFKGNLLIASESIDAPLQNSFDIIKVISPKLAFSIVVKEFFSDLLTTEFAETPSDYLRLNIRVAPDAKIAAGARLGSNTMIDRGVEVGPNTVIANSSVGCNSKIGANCTIGLPGFGFERSAAGCYHRFPHIGQVKIGEAVEIGSNTCIDRGALDETFIDDGVKIDNLVHVAHNVKIGRNAVVIANAMIAGSVQIDDGAWIAPSASIRNQLKIGAESVIGLGAVVTKNVEPHVTVLGNPASPRLASKEAK